MKVHIGPYREWIGPYQIVDKIFFWVDHRYIPDDDPRWQRWDYKLHDKFGDWLAETWVAKFCAWIDSKKKRKIKIKIDPYDTWSLDHTLALIVHPMLIQLKAMNHGYFSVDEDDTPHIETGEKDNYGSDSKAEERYNWVMDELIWTFDQLAHNEDYDLFYSKETGWDMEGSRKYNDRISNGLRLFGKYYRGLWD